MTPIGHSLVGASIGALVPMEKPSLRGRVVVMLAVAFCANLPDLPLPGWGHDAYHVSHSVFVGMLIVVCVTFVLRSLPFLRNSVGTWPLILAGSVAMFSHYLLDSFYNHGKGIAIFWPVSDVRLTLPIPWFSTMQPNPLLSRHNFVVWGIELVCFGLLFAVLLLVARSRDKKASDQPAANDG